MKIHEYQAKQIMGTYNVPISKGGGKDTTLLDLIARWDTARRPQRRY